MNNQINRTFNVWKTKQGNNNFVSIKIKDMSTLHLCKALNIEIRNYETLLREHNYLINRKKEVESQMQEVVLTGLNLMEELKDNRDYSLFKFNKKSVSEETLNCFFEQSEQQENSNSINK